MPFKDFAEFADPLALPINGKTYVVPPIGVQDGINLLLMIEEKKPLTNEQLGRMLLGAAYDTLMGDNVPADAFQRVIMTALAEFQHGRATAELIWETGGNPKAIQAATTPAAAANTTPRRASGNGTRTKKAQSRS